MDDQMLHGVSTVPRSEERKSFWERCFCCKKGGQKVVSEDERLEIARERWRKVSKLRFMLVSLKFAKEQTNEIEQGQYLGQVKEEEGEENGPPEKKCMIYPWYKWKTYFDMLCALLILYFCFATPFRIGFNSDDDNNSPIKFELAFDGILFIDIILTFFTAYIADIEVIDERWKIASRYLRGLFIFDLISCIPFYLIDANLMWLKIFRLLHVGRITTLLENSTALVSKMTSDKMILDWHTKIHISRIMRFLLYLATTCHCIACFWHYIAIKEDVPLKDTWMMGIEMTNQEAYVASLYWTMVTFSTVGYGDITPKTDAEIAYTMVVEFIGILFFAYLMGNVSSIISNINMRAQALSKRETDLDKWLLMLDKNRSDKRLKPELHAAIRNYFTYIWKNDHSYLINDSEFMMRLPYKLRNELTQHLFSDEVEKFEVFFKNCNEQFKYQVVLNMFPRKFKKFEEIIPEGVPVQEVYFIDAGSVLLGTRHGVQIFLKLPTRSYFGDNYIIFNNKPSICYLADAKGCELYCVKKEKFEKLLKRFPASFAHVAQRAYKRRKYFQAVMRSTVAVDPEAPLEGDAVGSSPVDRDSVAVLAQIEDNFEVMTEEENEELKVMLEKAQEQEDEFQKKALEDMEDAANKFKTLKRQIEELTSKMMQMQNMYEADLTKLTDVLNGMSQDAPLHEVLAKINSLQE